MLVGDWTEIIQHRWFSSLRKNKMARFESLVLKDSNRAIR